MKFSMRSKIRAGAKRSITSVNPAEIDTLESRLLLTTTPNILTPTGDVADATPQFTWEAVDGAESYDLWVTSLETYETAFVARDIVGTSYTAAEGEVTLGKIRIWARANFSDDTSSDWSPASVATIVAAPTASVAGVTGATNRTTDSTPEITWTSPRAASQFKIWVTDLTEKRALEQAAADAGSTDPIDVTSYSKQYTVQNLTPVLDDEGNPTVDDDGNLVLQEVRSFVIPEDPTDADSEPREFDMGRYRIWIRAIDLSGKATGWSSAYTFDVGPDPQNLTPDSPTFQVTPDLTWDTVDGATHYEVYVSEVGTTSPFFRRTVEATANATRQSTQMVQSQVGTPIVENDNGTVEAFERPLLDQDGEETLYQILSGEYRFWVRAINMGEGLPTVTGAWSAPATFSSIEAPAITAPVPDQGVITSATPTVTWTPIHGTARYEVLVHKFNSRPPFLEATSTTTSYTFAEALPAGQYTVWVRALDTRGNPSPWSAPQHMTITGGRPVITSPTPGEVVDFPTFTWVGVPEAASYEVWVSHVGVDFTFVNVSGIEDTSFQPNDPANPGSVPLSEGDYRIWVRAIMADGSFGPWSAPVSFKGGIPTTDATPVDDELMVTSLPRELNVEAAATTQPAQDSWQPDDSVPASMADFEEDVQPPADDLSPLPMQPVRGNAAAQLDIDLVSTLAQECVETEWWAGKDVRENG
ncbi:Fibronectin type III domain protein [Fuerstiella marisgermanici]|uniref:Fibronectin type III domain protein n=2 Tax=Fuerstiella marisgermanici TaxID=1891926 RepID=A0A1P8WKL7_9PLAN|nr:Fibronectin type III domain protein [Fuerstiella marisgermanici]